MVHWDLLMRTAAICLVTEHFLGRLFGRTFLAGLRRWQSRGASCFRLLLASKSLFPASGVLPRRAEPV